MQEDILAAFLHLDYFAEDVDLQLHVFSRTSHSSMIFT